MDFNNFAQPNPISPNPVTPSPYKNPAFSNGPQKTLNIDLSAPSPYTQKMIEEFNNPTGPSSSSKSVQNIAETQPQLNIATGSSSLMESNPPSTLNNPQSQMSVAPPSNYIPEMPTLQNIVSTVNLGIDNIDLKKIATQARNAEYNPKRFAAVIMRIRNPRTTALIFRTGKMVCTGARSIENSRHASRKFARIIQKLGYPEATFKDFKVQNMVGSVDVKFPIGLGFRDFLFKNHLMHVFFIYTLKTQCVTALFQKSPFGSASPPDMLTK